MRHEASERGQVLLITAAAMIVLLGVAALVVDLGFSWMLRRQEQNAADPAALAAARFISEPDPATGRQDYDATRGWEAACRYALMNGFFDPGNTSCAAETDGTRMAVNWPPQGSVSDYFVGDYGFVQVVISEQHPSFFGGILRDGRATVTTEAVAARQRGNTNTYSLVALNPTGCSTARVRGDSVINIHPAPGYTGVGGYVQVNGDCPGPSGDDNCGTAGQGALDVNGGATLIAPRTNVHGNCKGDGGQPVGDLDEAAHQIGDPLSGLQFPAWDTALPGAKCGQTGSSLTSSGSQGCGQGAGRLPWKTSPAASCPGLPAGHDCIELDPGIYYGGWSIGSKVRVNLKPGIYIIAGGGISIGSTGSLDSMAEGSSAAPVLVYSTDNPIYAATCPAAGTSKCQGNIDATAQASLKLAGLIGDQPCPPVTTTGGCPLGGMVVWHDGSASQGDSYSGQIDLEGGSELLLSGTIYAPRAHVDITGNVNTNCPSSVQRAEVQIISWTWDIGGTGDLCMPYNPSKLYKMTMQGLVH